MDAKQLQVWRYGCGVSNGVNYSYTLQTRQMSGRYECHIHRCFLDIPVKEFLSDPFIAAGRQWCDPTILSCLTHSSISKRHRRLRLNQDEGQIFAFLVLMSKAVEETHYQFTLINHMDCAKNVTKGWRGMVGSGTAKGYSLFLSAGCVQDSNVGYLLGDAFTVEVRIGRILSENKSFRIDSCGETCMCTWRLRRLEDLQFSDLILDDVQMGKMIWNLKLEPNKSLATKRDTCGVYFYGKCDLPTEVNVSVTLLNYGDALASRSKELACVYSVGRSCRGWRDFIEMQALFDPKLGFLDDGWLTLSVIMTAARSTNPMELWRDCLPALRSVRKIEMEQGSSQRVTEPLCVVCLVKKQTSGFSHGNTSHKCVCADCCRVLRRARARCPVCAAKVDAVIIDRI